MLRVSASAGSSIQKLRGLRPRLPENVAILFLKLLRTDGARAVESREKGCEVNRDNDCLRKRAACLVAQHCP